MHRLQGIDGCNVKRINFPAIIGFIYLFVDSPRRDACQRETKTWTWHTLEHTHTHLERERLTSIEKLLQNFFGNGRKRNQRNESHCVATAKKSSFICYYLSNGDAVGHKNISRLAHAPRTPQARLCDCPEVFMIFWFHLRGCGVAAEGAGGVLTKLCAKRAKVLRPPALIIMPGSDAHK